MVGRALYVGISKYNHEDYDDLPTCARAAEEMHRLLEFDADTSHALRWTGHSGQDHGPKLIGDSVRRVTGNDMQQSFKRFLESRQSSKVLFYFAGHGRPGVFPDSVGPGEDLLLAGCDDDPASMSSPQGLLVSQMLKSIGDAHLANATLILDCCYSGIAATMELPPNVVLFAATDVHQAALSWEVRDGYPQFTRWLIDGLGGSAKDARGWITALSLYAYAAGAMSPEVHGQRPTFKGQVSGLPVLHRAKGALSSIDLKRLAVPQMTLVDGCDVLLPAAFSGPNEPAIANGDWEETDALSEKPERSRSDPLGHDKSPEQDLMDYYNRLIKAGLAETTGGKDLFWTVMDSIKQPGKHGVMLNSLGKYYYTLSRMTLIEDEDT